MRILNNILWVLLFLPYPAEGQPFAPESGVEGSTAMHMDSSAFVAWAEYCYVERGPGLITCPDSVAVDYGNPEDAVGKADMNGVVSLGDGGMATLVFETPIRNVIGFDFAVFENGFDNFLELAFVEVSSDSIHFIRFPSRSETSVNQQVGSFGILDPAKIHNLAGKYQAGYGTPFDLEELKDSAGLDINSVNYVRIIDVIGILDDSLGSRDATGTLVNDPYPTPFSTGGFDLDAVGVIRTLTAGTGPAVEESLPVVYPNPFRDVISIRSPDFSNALFTVICPASGRIVRRGLTEGNIREMNLSGLARGMYILSIEENMKVYNIKIIKQ